MGNIERLVGPPPIAVFAAIGAVVFAITTLVTNFGPGSIGLAIALLFVAWRLAILSIDLEDDELVVQNIWGAERLPVDKLEVKPRDLDLVVDAYRFTDEDRPKTSDDNNKYKAKVYALEYEGKPYGAHALLARVPKQHEKAAWDLRQAILAARGEDLDRPNN